MVFPSVHKAIKTTAVFSMKFLESRNFFFKKKSILTKINKKKFLLILILEIISFKDTLFKSSWHLSYYTVRPEAVQMLLII